jgi:hypothetical protein
VNNNPVDSADVPRTALATLDAWRECGADRLDPLRFHFIVALERRAAAHDGDARRVLDERVAKLIHAYSADVERAALDAKPAASTAKQHVGEATQSLAGLVEYLADNTRESTAYPELSAVEYFRGVWSRVRSEKQIRQSLAPVSGNAGPLNSSSLVHRALSLMSELSPGYLKQFLSYVDTLSWMEQVNGGAPAAKETPRSGNTGRNGRGKAR